jgi:general secretion pathway protein A
MYLEHFGLRESPFSLTPDPRYLFMSDGHTEALASLIYGIQERRGFVLVVGEVGTGKTTLIRHLLGHFGDNVRTCYVFNTLVSFEELLEAILRDLDLTCSSRRRVDMIEVLNEYLIKEAESGRYVMLIIDEAQHLSSSALEDLRMLSNLETSRSNPLQIMLVGQPELLRRLALPSLRQFRQRIALVAELTPLSFREMTQYVGHRLGVAGRRHGIPFTRAALRTLYAASGGIPRLVNVLGDQAMILAFGDGANRVRRHVVKQAAKDRSFSPRPTELTARAASTRPAVARRSRLPSRRRRLPATILVSTAALAVLALAIWRGPDAIERLGWKPRAVSTETAIDGGSGAGLNIAATEAPTTAAAEAPTVATEAPTVAAEAPTVATKAPTVATEAPAVAAEAPTVAVPEPAATTVPAPELPPRSASPDGGGAAESKRAPPTRTIEIAVRPGDKLASILRNTYGHSSLTLLDHVAQANPTVHDISALDVTQRLRLPPFNPTTMVRQEGTAHYLVHVATVGSPELLERIRPAVARHRRWMYSVEVRLTPNVTGHRVLVGDFEERARAEEFARSFRLPIRLSDSPWG